MTGLLAEALVDENRRRILAGERADDVYPDAVRAAKHGYRLLEGVLRVDLMWKAARAPETPKPAGSSKVTEVR